MCRIDLYIFYIQNYLAANTYPQHFIHNYNIFNTIIRLLLTWFRFQCTTWIGSAQDEHKQTNDILLRLFVCVLISDVQRHFLYRRLQWNSGFLLF